MFEIGSGELILLFVVALLVLGPQRLPKVAAELGKWVGRARRTASDLRRQLEREIELSELERPPPPPPAPPSPPQPEATPLPPDPFTAEAQHGAPTQPVNGETAAPVADAVPPPEAAPSETRTPPPNSGPSPPQH